MAESKFDSGELSEAEEAEAKFMDGDEGDGVESKCMEPGEEKSCDDGDDDEDEDEEEESALAERTTLFGMDPIIEKLVDFWGEVLSDDVNTFFANHCSEFDDDGEHKLSYTKIHKKYEKIVEGHLQEFAAKENISQEEMYDRVRHATETNELADLILGLVLCCADYGCFVEIMKAKNQEMKRVEQFDEGLAEEKNAY